MNNVFSEEIFNPAFVLEGPHLVEASAGTGKTYNIQNIYARLVVEKGLRVEQIQVMTFTEAATKELRDRVRTVLLRFAALYAGNLPDLLRDMKQSEREEEMKRLEKLRMCARANIGGGQESADGTARANLEIALMEFDKASISTIHGFCRRSLQRFAFETDSPFQSEFEDNKSSAIALKVRDWWRNESDAVEESVRGKLDLGTLGGYAAALSGKSDWTVDGQEECDPNGWMLEKARTFVDEYEGERKCREVQTFDDLLRGLRDALHDEERGKILASRLRDEFKAALIDEFQDTDPVQYDIFKEVFLAPEALDTTMLFFVGDPKQAIYSFRGGDIYTYRRAVTSRELSGRKYRLDRNFRSTPRLVDAVNALFKDHDGGHTFGDGAIEYADNLLSSQKSALKLADGTDDPSPFRIVQFSGNGAASKRDDYVIRAVLETLEEQKANGLKPSDIAILVGSHDAAAKFKSGLRDHGVQSVLQRAGNVFSGAAAADFRQVLLAMAGIGGLGQIRTALGSSLVGMTPYEINDEKTFADMVGVFGKLGRTWRTKGFESAFAELEKIRNVRCMLAKHRDGERMLADVFQILDLAGAAVREIGPSPEALAAWISERIDKSMDDAAEKDSEEYARQLESEGSALKIMTIHASKGLQFPVVIIPLSRGVGDSGPFFYHDECSTLHVGLSDDAKAKSDVERDEEKTRLYYVAFTRASKRAVVVTENPSPGTPLYGLFENARANGAGEGDADSPIAWVNEAEETVTPNSQAQEETEAEDADTLNAYGPEEIEAEKLKDAEVPPVYDSGPTKGSYTLLAPGVHSGGIDDRDVDADAGTLDVTDGEDPIFDVPGGAKTGTCWHEILEKAKFDASDSELLELVQRTMRIHGCSPKDTDACEGTSRLIFEMMRKTLEYPIVSPDGRQFSLRDVRSCDRISEWEFDFSSVMAVDKTGVIADIIREEWADDASKRPFIDAVSGWDRSIPKGYFVGFLDLAFRHDGYYYVVDWKSNSLNRRKSGFTRQGVADEMADAGYFFQYLLYSVVLRKYLQESLGAAYSWEKNFGGIRYYFLRGVEAGAEAPVFEDRPGEKLLYRLSEALGLEAVR